MKMPQGRLTIKVGVCNLVYTHQLLSFVFQALQQQRGLREDGWHTDKGQRKVGHCKVALLVKKIETLMELNSVSSPFSLPLVVIFRS